MTTERVGFFTDTSVCIGCKACEVACKEWNDVPEDGLDFTGHSYDNTGRAGRRHLAPRRLRRAGSRRRAALAHVLRRVQALHVGRVPGGVPDRRALPHRVRHRRRAAGRLQRLRLLHPGLPVRRHRPARGGRPRAQVHPLLRPPQGRHDPGVREGVPDGVDPVRAARRDARARLRAPGGAAGRAASRARGCTARTPATASAARARSSCSSTSPRSTACRPIRSRPRATWARCGARRRARARRCWPGSPSRASAAGDERLLLRRGRSSRRRCGRGRSPPTSSSAGWPAPPRRSRCSASCAATDALARRAWLVALAGVAASPPLLISDLGRPERFHHMLRVLKPTSPMSVGSWVLGASSTAIALANARAVCFGWFPRLGARRAPPPCSARRCRPTPPCSWPTLPSPRGTRRAASCPSCSSPARR